MITLIINNISFITGRWPFDSSLPTIVFIHGSGSSKKFWKAQVQGLSENFNTIAIDLPGHGESNSSGMDSIEDYSGCVERFISEINPPSPVPCGLSMGGAITLNMLLNNNIDFKAGIIINSGAKLKVMPAIFDLIKNNYRGYISSIPSIGASHSTDISKLADVINDAEKSSPDVVYNDFSACNKFDVTGKLNSISKPVLVLTAEEDKLSPQKYGKFIADNITGSSHVHITSAGHFSPVEQPEKVNEAISEFIVKNFFL